MTSRLARKRGQDRERRVTLARRPGRLTPSRGATLRPRFRRKSRAETMCFGVLQVDLRGIAL
jgi:hypothetical protein